jgi:imidazolonepropionase-like amidohydrolase
VRAGVRSIEHGTYVTDETLQLMLERGTWLVPTLAVMSPLADPSGQSAEAAEMRNRIWHMQSALHAAVREALRIGVRIAAATDGSYGDADDTAALRVAHEVAELVALGMTHRQAIAAATSSAAELLGIDHRTGRIAEGLEADLLFFDRDPEVDLRVLFEPLLVINNGEIAVDRLY